MKCHGCHTTLPQPLATAPSCFPSLQGLHDGNSSQTLLSLNFSCFSPKITSPPHCTVLVLLPEDCDGTHFSPTSTAITYSGDWSHLKLPYTPVPQPSYILLHQWCLLSFSPSERSKEKASLLPPPSSSPPPSPPQKAGVSPPCFLLCWTQAHVCSKVPTFSNHLQPQK